MSPDFGARMREAREAKDMTHIDVIVELRAILPKPMWISQSKLSRIERGDVAEDHVDPHLVGVLALIYNKPVSSLSESAAAALKTIADLGLGASGWLIQAA